MLAEVGKCYSKIWERIMDITICTYIEYDISYMTPVALLQDRAGAGPNEPTSSQFLELG